VFGAASGSHLRGYKPPRLEPDGLQLREWTLGAPVASSTISCGNAVSDEAVALTHAHKPRFRFVSWIGACEDERVTGETEDLHQLTAFFIRIDVGNGLTS
jgi:hypothetical protein